MNQTKLTEKDVDEFLENVEAHKNVIDEEATLEHDDVWEDVCPDCRTNEIAAALAKAQAVIKPPKKNRTANIKMKNGGTYSYKFADLTDCYAAALPVLSKNGLSVTHTMNYCDEGGIALHTRLLHSSGQELHSVLPLPNYDNPQSLGSLLTYFKRYAFCAIIGLSSEEDDDAQSVVNQAPSKGKTMVGASGAKRSNLVTEAQRKRLFAITNNMNITQDEIKLALQTLFNKKSSKDLTKDEYKHLDKLLDENDRDQFVELISDLLPSDGVVQPGEE